MPAAANRERKIGNRNVTDPPTSRKVPKFGRIDDPGEDQQHR